MTTLLAPRTHIIDKPHKETAPPAPPRPAEKPPRLVSLDAYRGFIMLAMASSGLYLWQVAKSIPESDPTYSIWKFLAFHTDHVEWVGGGFWDMIQPSFMFMVGVAVPYSYASRKAKGTSEPVIWLHTIWRAFLLVALAVFLSSPLTTRLPVATADGLVGSGGALFGLMHGETYFIFTNVLAQIGLGYVFVCLLRGRGLWVQLGGLTAVLVGSWLLFVLWPLPPEGFDYASVGVPADWQHLPGFFAHWDKGTNVGAAFDTWLLNLFPRRTEYLFNAGGYTTLNFIPSMATMILGLLAGEMLRAPGTRTRKLLYLIAAGMGCLVVGRLAGAFVCPIVKRIWTPSWAVYSSGWTFLMLAAFYGIIDVIGWKKWALPLTVVGMNSIAIYCMSQLMRGFLKERLHAHLPWVYDFGNFSIIVESAVILLVFWLICAWMYRRGIFLRI